MGQEYRRGFTPAEKTELSFDAQAERFNACVATIG